MLIFWAKKCASANLHAFCMSGSWAYQYLPVVNTRWLRVMFKIYKENMKTIDTSLMVKMDFIPGIWSIKYFWFEWCYDPKKNCLKRTFKSQLCSKALKKIQTPLQTFAFVPTHFRMDCWFESCHQWRHSTNTQIGLAFSDCNRIPQSFRRARICKCSFSRLRENR